MSIDIESREFKQHQRSVQEQMAASLDHIDTQQGVERAILLPMAYYTNSSLANLSPKGLYFNFEQNQSRETPFKIAGALYIGDQEHFSEQRFSDMLVRPQAPEKQALANFLWQERIDPDDKITLLKKYLPFNTQKDIQKITRSLHKIIHESLATNEKKAKAGLTNYDLQSKIIDTVLMVDLPMLSYSIHRLINYMFARHEQQYDWPTHMYDLSARGDFTVNIDVGREQKTNNTCILMQGARYWPDAIFNMSRKPASIAPNLALEAVCAD